MFKPSGEKRKKKDDEIKRRKLIDEIVKFKHDIATRSSPNGTFFDAYHHRYADGYVCVKEIVDVAKVRHSEKELLFDTIKYGKRFFWFFRIRLPHVVELPGDVDVESKELLEQINAAKFHCWTWINIKEEYRRQAASFAFFNKECDAVAFRLML